MSRCISLKSLRRGGLWKKGCRLTNRGVYEKFLVMGGGSANFLGTRYRGLWKNPEFSGISTRAPPPVINERSLRIFCENWQLPWLNHFLCSISIFGYLSSGITDIFWGRKFNWYIIHYFSIHGLRYLRCTVWWQHGICAFINYFSFKHPSIEWVLWRIYTCWGEYTTN